MRIELPIISFLCIPLVLLPLPWHWRARNVATLTMIVTMFLVNLIHGVNSIVWAGSVVVRAPVWCDIATKLIVGAQVSLPAASLCIAKHLESVASVRNTNTTRDDKRRRTIFEICLCVVFPIVIMGLHVIVQGHRFDIMEDFGCQPTLYYSWPGFVIFYLPPLVLAVLCLGYASVGFYWFLQRRAQFAEHLESCRSGLTTGRYFRLMAFSVTSILTYTILGGYVLGVTIQDSHMRVWDNWAHVHSNFGRIAQFPRVLVPEFFWTRLLVTWYIVPIGSVAFFVFFGFGQEARVEYGRGIEWFRTQILRLPAKASSDSVLPTFSAPRTCSKPRAERTIQLGDLDDLDEFDDDMISLDEKGDGSSFQSSTTRSFRPMSTPPETFVPGSADTYGSQIGRPLSAPPSSIPEAPTAKTISTGFR